MVSDKPGTVQPVVIIKDEKTPFSFDTSHIKHLEYPSDLRFQVIEKFIEDLANLILETVQASKKKDYKTFLSHYAPIKVTTLNTNEVSEKIALESILNSINNLENKVNNLTKNTRTQITPENNLDYITKNDSTFILEFNIREKNINLIELENKISSISDIKIRNISPSKLKIQLSPNLSETEKSKKWDQIIDVLKLYNSKEVP